MAPTNLPIRPSRLTFCPSLSWVRELQTPLKTIAFPVHMLCFEWTPPLLPSSQAGSSEFDRACFVLRRKAFQPRRISCFQRNSVRPPLDVNGNPRWQWSAGSSAGHFSPGSVRGGLGIRIYKDVRPTGNSWTVFLQATSAQPLTRQIHRRNARQIRPLNLCRDARQIRHLSQFPHPSESQGLPSETQGS